MKNYILILIVILTLGCFQKNQKKVGGIYQKIDLSDLYFNDIRINAWEIATTDSINHLCYKLYKSIDNESFYYKKIIKDINILFDHGGRRILTESLSNDSVFRSFKQPTEIILIECIDNEKRPSFDILINKIDHFEMLIYRRETKFILKRKINITLSHVKKFIELLENNNLIDTTMYKSEFDYVITRFIDDKIIIYPFLTCNFNGEIRDTFIEMLNRK